MGAGGSGASFWAYLGQFRGLFKEFSAKTGGRAPPPPLDPRLRRYPNAAVTLTHCLRRWSKITAALGQRLVFAGWLIAVRSARQLLGSQNMQHSSTDGPLMPALSYRVP